MENFELYERLGLSTKGASNEVIKAAYKRLAKTCHPDKFPNDKEAEEKFKSITEAYEVLKDPEKRKSYDETGHISSNNEENQIRQQAVSQLIALFMGMFDNIDVGMLGHFDLKQSLEKNITGNIQELKNQILAVRRDIHKIKEFQKRLRHKGSENFIKKAMENRLDQANKALKQLSRNVRMWEVVNELSVEYDYEKMVHNFFSNTSTSTTTSNGMLFTNMR